MRAFLIIKSTPGCEFVSVGHSMNFHVLQNILYKCYRRHFLGLKSTHAHSTARDGCFKRLILYNSGSGCRRHLQRASLVLKGTQSSEPISNGLDRTRRVEM